MGLIRKFAVQAHAVPETVGRTLGPFPPEVLAQNRVERNDYDMDSMHEAFDDIRMFKCKVCREVLYEDELSIHECEEENGS